MLGISTEGGKLYEGNTVALDPITKSLVIQNDGKFIVLNQSQITGVDGALNLETPDPSLFGNRLVFINKTLDNIAL